MEGAYQQAAAFAGFAAKALAHHCGGVHVDVDVCCSGLYCREHSRFGFGGRAFLRHPTGGYEGLVDRREEVFYFFGVEGTGVEAYFGHLHVGALQDGEYFVCLFTGE